MATYADTSGLVDGDPNLASSVKTPINQLDAAIVALEAAGLLLFSITAQTAGEALSERDVVYLDPDDSQWYQLDTDATPVEISAVRGVVAESGGIPSGNTGEVRVIGTVEGFTGLTAFAPVYASSSPGGYTQTKPTVTAGGAQKALIQIGIALSTTQVMVQNHHPVTYLKRASLADDGTLTIQHHADAQTRTRQARGISFTTVAGSSLATYADTNQDEDVNLMDRTPATYGSDECTGGTASASSYNAAGQESDKAFDDSTATFWASSAKTDEWLAYEFASAKTIRQYTIQIYTNTTQDPTGWDLEYYDGADWQVADSVTGESEWSSLEKRTYTVDAPYSSTQWRLKWTSGGSGSTRYIIAEVEMMEVATYNDGNETLAQSFQVTGAQDVGSAKLWLKKVGSPTGNLTLKIYDDNSGEPGSLVTNGTSNTVAASGLSTSYGWITFTFGTAPSLSGSTTYWLVLETTDTADESNYVGWGADGSSPSYADGEMLSYDGSTWNAESKDACFEVFGEGTEYEEPVAIQRWSMTDTLDLAVRFDDGSGTNGDTQTTFKNVSGGTLDVTCMVEVQ